MVLLTHTLSHILDEDHITRSIYEAAVVLDESIPDDVVITQNYGASPTKVNGEYFAILGCHCVENLTRYRQLNQCTDV